MTIRAAILGALAMAIIVVATVLGPAGVPTEVSGATVVATVGAGSASSHSCIVTDNGGAKCWGRNNFGQLGDGTTTDRLAPVDVVGLETGVVSVSTGNGHSCAVTATGGAMCWGRNTYGQLGDGQACGFVCTTAVDVAGMSDGVAVVAAGFVHTCGLTTAGVVRCWGNNFHGQLGIGGSPGNFQTTPMDVFQLASGAISIAAGDWHACAVTATGAVKCWGENLVGQLGDGGCCVNRTVPVNVSGLSSGIAEVATGAVHTCAVTTAGSVKCWGRNADGQLGDGTTIDRLAPVDVVGLETGVDSVSMGSGHTCAVTTVGGVKCWGRNADGRLGDGTTTNQLVPVDVSGLESGVVAAGGGSTHTCALTTAGNVTCWGQNSYGQLGDGTLINRSTPVSLAGLKPTPTPTPVPTPTIEPPKNPSGDTDGDTILNSSDTDDDNDGCTDVQELGTDETRGGQRNPHNPYDFYDVLGPGSSLPKDGVIDLPNDILGVILHFSPLGTEPEYDVQFDRGPVLSGKPWNMTAPDGVIDLPNDVLGVLLQFDHDCT